MDPSPPATASTREKFLRTAAAQILKRGYAGTSLSGIAAAHGATKGALSYHFPTKAAFAEAIGEHFLDVLKSSHRDAIIASNEGGMRALIWFLIGVGTAAANDERAAAASALIADPSSPQAPVTAILAQWRQSVADFLAEGIELGEVNPSTTVEISADYLTLDMIGTMVFSRRILRPDDAPRMRFLRLALRGVGTIDPDTIVDDVLSHASQLGALRKLPSVGLKK